MKLKYLVLLLVCFAIVYYPRAQDNAAKDLVYESPIRLTRTMMEQHAQFVQKLLDVDYTPQQTEKHFQLIKNYWIENDFNGMKTIESNLEFAKQLNTLPAAELEATILQLRSSLVLSLVEEGRNAADSRWYLQNYLETHPPLLHGDIPFIRETADALIDCEYFISKELKNKTTVPVTKEQRDAAYIQLAKEWELFDTEKKKVIMLGASRMSIIFYRWGKMSLVDKINIKLQYVGEEYLTASEKSLLHDSMVQNYQQNSSQHWGLIQKELNYMKQSTDIIMGHGIRWDPSRNRYVQDGGIVTEFW